MSTGFFGTLITTPLYNGIVFLASIVPGLDLGIIVILFTVLVRLVLFPLAHKSIKTQIALKNIQGDIDVIKKEYAKNSQEQARKIMELYKAKGVNPFGSFLFLFIQIPIIFGLYFVFLRGGLPVINLDFVYSFVHPPKELGHVFLGLIDITQKSIVLALLAGVTQFFQARMMNTSLPQSKEQKSFGADFAKGLKFQVNYIFPIIIMFIAYSLPASMSLYWITTNLFSIGQEWYVKRNKYKSTDE